MNGIIIIDKPPSWTSQDVCAKLRGVLHERRVGHSGTLDPLATGVLPVFVGRATRAVSFAENHQKRYTAALRPGLVTDTQDITGEILSRQDCAVTDGDLLAVLPEFTGEIRQIPPMYSAVKIGGRKLYRLARAGQTVERPARPVTVYSLTLLGREGGDFLLDVVCSKGTYIRTLCHDIGARLGCGACMSALRRTQAGPFAIGQAHTLAQVEEAVSSGRTGDVLLPVDSLFSLHPAVTLDAGREKKCRCGNDFPLNVPDGLYRVYGESGEFLMLGRAEGGRMGTVKSFFEP